MFKGKLTYFHVICSTRTATLISKTNNSISNNILNLSQTNTQVIFVRFFLFSEITVSEIVAKSPYLRLLKGPPLRRRHDGPGARQHRVRGREAGLRRLPAGHAPYLSPL